MSQGLSRTSLVLGVALAATSGGTASANDPAHPAHIVQRTALRTLAHPASATRRVAPWATALGAIDVRNRNTTAKAKVRLYADDGSLDAAALKTVMRVAASTADASTDPNAEIAEPLDTRLVQLVVRASYHFGGAPIVIVSATRKGSPGKHGTGDALDFQLDGVRAGVLAAYVRTFPQAGVGIYTHPKTQYVHVDVRERSFHWLDASPPGVTWREMRLADPHGQERDDRYSPRLDLPETAQATANGGTG